VHVGFRGRGRRRPPDRATGARATGSRLKSGTAHRVPQRPARGRPLFRALGARPATQACLRAARPRARGALAPAPSRAHSTVPALRSPLRRARPDRRGALRARVLEEQLVEVSHAEEKQGVACLFLGGVVVPHHRGLSHGPRKVPRSRVTANRRAMLVIKWGARRTKRDLLGGGCTVGSALRPRIRSPTPRSYSVARANSPSRTAAPPMSDGTAERVRPRASTQVLLPLHEEPLCLLRRPVDLLAVVEQVALDPFGNRPIHDPGRNHVGPLVLPRDTDLATPFARG